MKSLLVFLILAFLSTNLFSIEKEYDKILKKTIEVYNAHNSIYYTADCILKFPMDSDTFKISGECVQIKVKAKDKTDLLYWYSAKDGREVISLSDISYNLIRNKNQILKFSGRDHKEAVSGNNADDLINSYFFNPEKLLSFSEDSSIIHKIHSVDIEGKQMWQIENFLPDTKDVSDTKITYWIDKKTKTLRQLETKLKFMGDYQYQLLTIKNEIYDLFNENILEHKIDSLAKIYRIIDADSMDRANDPRKKIIDSGKNAPDFSGNDYASKEQKGLNDFKGKLVLLDFWYMACAPCIQAMPSINILYKKYKDQGFIALGINNKDEPKGNNRLEKFIQKKIQYPVICVDDSVDKAYNVSAYPTFYLIDRKGKVIYSGIGYAEEEMKKLEEIIKENL